MGHSFDRFYWKDWAAALRVKLAGKGLELGEEHFGGVYYYDLVPGPKEEMAADERIQIQLLGLRERAIGELGILRAPFARGIEAVKKLADHIIDNFGDIFAYLYLENTRAAVNDRLYEAVSACSGPVHLVGYSLGSLVCYCALKENRETAQRVSQLIMVGSPLYWFKTAVAECAGLESRPAVGYFSNIAGILDIAWPQAVPGLIGGLDRNIEFTINLFDPIKGHREYFRKEEGLGAITTELLKNWNG